MKPFGRAVQAIPAPIANAMLAGVLFGLCLAPFRTVAEQPLAGLLIVAAWLLVGRINRLFAVPAAVLVAAVLIANQTDISGAALGPIAPMPVLVTPEFSLEALGLALPLFLVTMASQNIPGIAILNANNYRPSPGPLFAGTGLFSLAAAPFGGHAVNLAAITAALCAGPEAHRSEATVLGRNQFRRRLSAVRAGGRGGNGIHGGQPAHPDRGRRGTGPAGCICRRSERCDIRRRQPRSRRDHFSGDSIRPQFLRHQWRFLGPAGRWRRAGAEQMAKGVGVRPVRR